MSAERQTAKTGTRSSFGSIQVLIMMALFIALSIVFGQAAVIYGGTVPNQFRKPDGVDGRNLFWTACRSYGGGLRGSYRLPACRIRD